MEKFYYNYDCWGADEWEPIEACSLDSAFEEACRIHYEKHDGWKMVGTSFTIRIKTEDGKIYSAPAEHQPDIYHYVGFNTEEDNYEQRRIEAVFG